jgi:hypothetical protein
MDDDLQQLEAELTRLRPVRASRDLNIRIAEELGPQALQSRPNGRAASLPWAWVILPIAAAALIFAGMVRRSPISPVPAPALSAKVAPAGFKPVHAENLLLDARDEGIVTFTDGTPARRVRQSYVDTITWRNPHTNASLTWSLPREEIRIVPVNFQ